MRYDLQSFRRSIDVYNHGEMFRDWTYVDNPLRAIHLLMDAMPVCPVGAEAIQDGDT